MAEEGWLVEAAGAGAVWLPELEEEGELLPVVTEEPAVWDKEEPGVLTAVPPREESDVAVGVEDPDPDPEETPIATTGTPDVASVNVDVIETVAPPAAIPTSSWQDESPAMEQVISTGPTMGASALKWAPDGLNSSVAECHDKARVSFENTGQSYLWDRPRQLWAGHRQFGIQLMRLGQFLGWSRLGPLVSQILTQLVIYQEYRVCHSVLIDKKHLRQVSKTVQNGPGLSITRRKKRQRNLQGNNERKSAEISTFVLLILVVTEAWKVGETKHYLDHQWISFI